MRTWLNRGRLRRPRSGLEDRERISQAESINRLTHRNSDTPTWLGLVPSQYSSGGKARLGHITKAGDSYIRWLSFRSAPTRYEALFDGVRRRPFRPEAVRVRVSRSFCNRVQRQKPQRLHGPITHARNAQGALLAIALRDVHAVAAAAVDNPGASAIVSPSSWTSVSTRSCRRRLPFSCLCFPSLA